MDRKLIEACWKPKRSWEHLTYGVQRHAWDSINLIVYFATILVHMYSISLIVRAQSRLGDMGLQIFVF